MTSLMRGGIATVGGISARRATRCTFIRRRHTPFARAHEREVLNLWNWSADPAEDPTSCSVALVVGDSARSIEGRQSIQSCASQTAPHDLGASST